ncbi:hypothetical protein GCM10010273_58110 [Streptomyces lavendulocolor]
MPGAVAVPRSHRRRRRRPDLREHPVRPGLRRYGIAAGGARLGARPPGSHPRGSPPGPVVPLGRRALGSVRKVSASAGRAGVAVSGACDRKAEEGAMAEPW